MLYNFSMDHKSHRPTKPTLNVFYLFLKSIIYKGALRNIESFQLGMVKVKTANLTYKLNRNAALKYNHRVFPFMFPQYILKNGGIE